MYLLVVFLPVIGACVSGFFGRQLGSRGSMLVSTTCIGISALLSCFIFYEVALSQSICSIKLFP
jgi:NADH-ubiquinone oxidoreductase chain 5